MALFDKKKFITEQRASGLSDEAIFDQLVEQDSEIKEKVERGFFGEILPTAGQIGGGIIGGVLGAGAGGVGAVPGAIGGAAIGGALGETAQQAIEQTAGDRKSLDPSQIIATGITGAVLEPVGQVGGKIVGKALGKAGKLVEPLVAKVRPKLVNFLSKLSGFTDEIVEKAVSRSPGVKFALEKGERAVVEVIENSRKKIGELKGLISKDFGERLDKVIKTETLGGPGQEASRALQLKEVGRFKLNAAKILRNNNIGVNQDGKLLFNRTSAPSRIVNSAEQKNIQESFNLLQSIEKNTSPKHIEAVLERIRALKKFDTPSGAQTSKIVNGIFDEAEAVTRQLYPKLSALRSEYSLQKKLIEDAEDLLGNKPLDALEKKRITTKLYQIYNTGSLPQREAAEALGEVIGEDITGTSAGAIIKAGDTFSMRATQLTTRGVAEKFVNAVPRKLLESYAKTGKITGEIGQSDFFNKLISALQIAAKAGSREAINLLESKTSD